MLVRGSLPWHETRTHMAAAERAEGGHGGEGRENGRGEVCGRVLSLSLSLSRSRGSMG